MIPNIFVLLPLLLLIISNMPAGCGAQPNPNLVLEGTKRRFPTRISGFDDNADLTRLLDVGACIRSNDPLVSYVPPLDGTSPGLSLCQNHYFMKFVLFDLQLVELKTVDPIGGSFQAQIQMIFHWLDYMDEGSLEMDINGNCNFLCDNDAQSGLCCDDVWIPPLGRLPGCDVNGIQSSSPMPYIHTIRGKISSGLSAEECVNKTYSGHGCYWRRLWYLNIDATCRSQMDFHNFPFDVQGLTMDFLNPYASRTWFQLTKGFLNQNVGEGINSVKLSPDSKIPGWNVKNVKLSGTCGITQAWKETFLTQNSLLLELQDSHKGYVSQRDEILDALSTEKLVCVPVEDTLGDRNKDMGSPLDADIYWNFRKLYVERVKSTLEQYNICVQKNGKDFAWNMSIHNVPFMTLSDNVASRFSTSEDNIRRSFNVLGLAKDHNPTKIWFPCAITAVANLTTPGIRVTILVQRYIIFYVVKLILPTIACVFFSFTAFGLQPRQLLGRLSVVVPSAIALTALQGFVVATDLPPVAYIAPSTYIILISYFVQLLVAYESIVVKWMSTRKRMNFCLEWRGAVRSAPSKRDAPNFNKHPKQYSSFARLKGGEEGIIPSTSNATNTMQEGLEEAINTMQEGGALRSSSNQSTPAIHGSSTHRASKKEKRYMEPEEDAVSMRKYSTSSSSSSSSSSLPTNREGEEHQRSATRIVDLVFVAVVGPLYTLSIILCTVLPYLMSTHPKHEIEDSSVTIWPNTLS